MHPRRRSILPFIAVIATVVASFAPAARAQATRPALAQLEAEVRGLYRQVEAGTVRVMLPPKASRPGPSMAPRLLEKWAPHLDPDVRQQLERELRDAHERLALPPQAEGRPRDGDRGATTAPSDDGARWPDAPFGNLRVVPLTRGDDGRERDRVGLVLDDRGHVLLPAYVDPSALGDRPLRVTRGADGKATTATVVGADPKTNLTVLRLADPAGLAPLRMAAGKPADGQLVLVVPLSRAWERLVVWAGERGESALVVSTAGEAFGFVQDGHLMAPGATANVARQLVEHGKVRRAVLGVTVIEVPQETVVRQQFPALGDRPALLVEEVLPGTAAARAGFRAGDLILELAGQGVGDTPAFAAAIADRSGATELKVLRGDEEVTLSVELKPE